jgi:hypothetical protein
MLVLAMHTAPQAYLAPANRHSTALKRWRTDVHLGKSSRLSAQRLGVCQVHQRLGAKAKFSFTGTSVTWASPIGTHKGKAEVWIDGVKVATVDLYASTSQVRKVIFTRSWSTVGSHTLEVRATGTKNASSGGKRVDVDAFVVLR